MTADYAGLEARVSELEQQVRYMLPVKIDAVSYGVSLVHEDTRYLREQSDIHGAALVRLETRLDRHGDLLHQHGDALERLETRLDRQNDVLERHSGQLERLETRLDRQNDVLERHSGQLERHSGLLERHSGQLEGLETRLERHGELLHEILRRLPSGPPDEA
jgi:uncharacterized coiled-coil protein SlyX